MFDFVQFVLNLDDPHTKVGGTGRDINFSFLDSKY